MRITPYQYASALWQAIRETEKGKENKILANFFRVLQKNKHLKLLPFILESLEKIADKENKILKLEVITAAELEDKKILEESLQKSFPGYNIQIAYRVDKDIKGGIVVKYNNTVIDGSWQRKIDLLKNVLLK